jgi:site-specific DNA recombinase
MKAVAYARFSSENQNENSIIAQLRAIREYAKKNGVSIVREYIDEAKSATTDDRPEFLRMIAEITSGIVEVDLVFVHKFDRFARNRYDAAVYRHQLGQKSVRLVAVDQPLDDSPESVILEALLEGMAEYYSKNLSREIKKVKKENALQGLHRGGTPPLGYDVDPVTMKYIINPIEAEVVRETFSLAAENQSLSSIVKKLNSKGYKTKRDRPFGKNSIHDLLRNPKYSGQYIANRFSNEAEIAVVGAIPAIIDESTWRSVQAIMDARKHVTTKTKKTEFLLTGKLFCGECGAAYTGNSMAVSSKKRKPYYHYSCVNRRQNHTCNNRNVRKELIEDYVLDYIEAVFNNANLEEVAEEAIKSYSNIAKANHHQIVRLKKSIQEITGRIEKLFDAIETGTMPSNIAGPRITKLTDEKAGLEQTLSDIECQSSFPYSKEKLLKILTQERDYLIERKDPEACRRLVNTYVVRVTFYRDDIDIELKIKNKPAGTDNDPSGSCLHNDGSPNGIRTRVSAVRGRCPRPLDDRTI